ncbi:VOC family protein [Niallia oryzisoli]|uniref:VOC family protein n=1 Tax=Niallia oryzisoli TaxID=1737571 RepID=A0ABZ2CBS3_9BACI
MKLLNIHHVAIICSNYEKSKDFYIRILGLTPIREVYREERDSYKLDLEVNGHYQIELFSFSNPPKRPSYPEAAGLRHLAFAVEDIEEEVSYLTEQKVEVEKIRIDPYTRKKFTFFADPDGLPIEIYEQEAQDKRSKKPEADI